MMRLYHTATNECQTALIFVEEGKKRRMKVLHGANMRATVGNEAIWSKKGDSRTRMLHGFSMNALDGRQGSPA
jgi:hypothetical protein